MQRILAILLIGAALGFAVWILWPSSPADDEALIRQAISEMSEGASQKKVGDVLDHVSPSYRGEGGSRDELKGYLLGYLLRSDWVTALPARVEVTVAGDTADTRLVVLLARGPAKTVAEVSPEGLAGSHLIEAKWARDDEGWKVIAATRRSAAPADWLH